MFPGCQLMAMYPVGLFPEWDVATWKRCEQTFTVFGCGAERGVQAAVGDAAWVPDSHL